MTRLCKGTPERFRLFFVILAVTALGACGSAPPPRAIASEEIPEPEEERESARPPAPELTWADGEGPQEIGGDALVQVPAGWSIARDERGAHFRPPEGDMHIAIAYQAIAEPFEEEDQARIIAFAQSAWQRMDPTFRRAPAGVRVVAGTPWDLLAQVHFDGDAASGAAYIAVVAASGERAYVAILDGTVDALARRGADANILIGSLTPQGLAREDWSALEAHELDDARLEALRVSIEGLRAAEDVPGAAVLIARGDEVLLSEGFGQRTAGGRTRVGDQTLFMIGSATKPFVSLLAARLIAAERTSWDAPIAEILPDFALADAEATAALQLRHAFCACTGFPRRDLEFIFEYEGAGAQRCLDTLRTLSPTTEFGGTFQYSNQLVALGGYALGRVYDARRPLEEAFARALDREVLRPLGMRSTTLSIARARRRDHAAPHALNLDGEVVAIPFDVEGSVESVGPAGALWSNLRDLTKYVQMELRGGTLARGRPFLDESALLARREAGVAAGNNAAYGLGLFRYDLNGVIAFGHNGNTLGFTSDVTFFPTLDLAVVTLANAGGADGLTQGVRSLVLEAVLGVDLDPLEAAAGRRRFRDQALTAARADIRPPTGAEAASMVGTYTSSALGEITIRSRDDGGLEVDAGEWRSGLSLSAESGGRFQWLFEDAPLAGLPLLQEGNALRIPFPQAEYVFERVPAAP